MNNIENSSINWLENTPYSVHFKDFYYNSDGGVKETQHVFINPSKIVERYLKMQTEFFCINETGFGTGLNFYCTLQAIQDMTKIAKHRPLHFYSTELFPLSADDFRKAVANFPQFSTITQQICLQYPPAVKGFHRIILNQGGVYLTLIFDDSTSAYQQCQHKTDAWYLDGFSPAKNSQMWQPELFQQLARLSKTNVTTLATFTSAGAVRRTLQQQGYKIQKHSGFGKKREMISGLYCAEDQPVTVSKPWFDISPSCSEIKHVAVIGAGLAGCTTAEALARRGIKVTIFDCAADICQSASGNLQGALYAKLPSKPTPSGEFHLTGLEYSLRLLTVYQCFDDQTAQQCGLLQLATNQKEQRQQQDLLQQNSYAKEVVRWVDSAEASALAGTKTPFSGLFFPRAGWVAPKLFCQKLIDNENIQLQLNTNITQLTQLANKKWQLTDSTGQVFVADAVVVANANSAKLFSQLQSVATKAIRGQVTHSQAKALPLDTVVCGAGYISPATQGQYCFGASFNLHEQSLELQISDQQTNIDNLHKVLPELAAQLELSEQLCGKVALRCSTPDYLPMVGPAPINDAFISQYKKLNKDKNWSFAPAAAPNYPGLFVNLGHGSKGLITCPLSAEYLASLLTNQPSPLPRDLSQAIHPARFTIKQLIRRTI